MARGIGTALAILASGAVQGYRATQEQKRQILEARRRALMEEKELGLRERQITSQEALGSAQIEHLGAQGESLREEALVKRGERERGSRPITGNGVPLKLRMLGNELSIPSPTMGDIGSLDDLIRGEYDIAGRHVTGGYDLRGKRLENQFRIDNPDLYGGRSRLPKTEDERENELLREVLNLGSDAAFLPPEQQEQLIINRIKALEKSGRLRSKTGTTSSNSRFSGK